MEGPCDLQRWPAPRQGCNNGSNKSRHPLTLSPLVRSFDPSSNSGSKFTRLSDKQPRAIWPRNLASSHALQRYALRSRIGLLKSPKRPRPSAPPRRHPQLYCDTTLGTLQETIRGLSHPDRRPRLIKPSPPSKVIIIILLAGRSLPPIREESGGETSMTASCHGREHLWKQDEKQSMIDAGTKNQ